jgi:glutaredoxin-like protein
MPETRIKVYGTTWCPDCVRAKQVLARHSISYDWIDISSDGEARAYLEKVNRGNRSVPTIVFPDGSIMVEPSNSELEKKLLALK